MNKRRKLWLADQLLTSLTLNKRISKVTWKDFKSIVPPITSRMLLNDERFYWHQLDGIAFEFEYWKIWHFPTLLKWKHLLSWRPCYASISSRHVWRPQRDTVSVLPFSSKGSPSLTTCTPELKKLAGTCKFVNEQLNVNLCIVLFVDCVHNMPSRNSCQES